MRRILCASALLLGAWSNAASGEVVLRAATGLPTNLEFSQSFLKNFVERVNQEGKGIVSINYVGGPEFTPPGKMGSALQRGVIDLLHSPASYYAGEVPEVNALSVSNIAPADMEKAGVFTLLDPIWKKKLNAKILGWPEGVVQSNFFLTQEPVISDDKGLDLRGLKMRSSPAYRAFLDAAGASAVNISVSELYTSLERGLVQGLGYSNVGLAVTGVGKFIKYRIDPPFYYAPVLVLMNADKYAALPANAKQVIEKVMAEYNQTGAAFMKKAVEQDEVKLKAEGMKVITLQGAARKAYLDMAYASAWAKVPSEGGDDSKLRTMLYRQQ